MKKVHHSRRCGECFACCFVMEITQLPEPKPANAPCPHQLKLPVLRPEGTPKLHGCCDIYAKRPPECRQFQCIWLAETDQRLMKYAKHRKAPRMFRTADRPDISGILIHPPGKEAAPTLLAAGTFVLHAREVWPGAAEEEAGKEMLNRLGDKFPVILIRGDRRTLFGPEDVVRRLMEAAEQRKAR